ncbi:MAG TPA: tetratricopeptide repeat protein [Thermoguttaceae bacterium]|nr:tetratricopeptide repeat protein [Thermoguttaceae bacterium]
MTRRFLLIGGLLRSIAVMPACRLPGREGPVPAALAQSRQYSQEGVVAMEQGCAEQARELLAKAVQTCPEDPEARRDYAEALWKCDHRDKAIAELEQAVAMSPKDARLRVRMARMRLALGQIDQARGDVDAAMDMDPELGDAWAMRARVLRASGNAQAALADYHRALQYSPNHRDVLLETAELYRQLNQPEKALAVLHRLIDTYGPDEEPREAIYLEGLAYAALGRYDQAAERYSTALARGEPTPEMLYQLAVVRQRAGQPREATAAAEAALRLNPDHLPCRQLIEQLGVAHPPTGSIRR